MRPHWLALVETEPRSAVLRAPVRDGGWVAVWDDERRDRRKPGASIPGCSTTKDPDLEVGLAAGDPGVSLPFDDPAVTGAIRSALASEPAVMCTTLMDDSGDTQAP